MDLQDIAASILWGTSLESKLQPVAGLKDHAPKAVCKLPEFPGRPDILRPRGERAKFPLANQLHIPENRGMVLHFFANHELLAIELMALALLKFPDAPKDFRQGIAATISEEQSHLRLYKKRMEDLGLGLGEIPVNFYFWKALKEMKSPLDYVAGMGMTFEQANLDYCQYYMKLMNEWDDAETAGLLKKVYDDEIGHVKYGVSWFEKWRDPNESQWESYRKTIMQQVPLNPVRAKGIGFDRWGRRQAGLSQDFVETLEIYESTKGKDPVAYWYNADCELEIAHGGPGYTPSKGVDLLRRDFECLPMFLAKRGDLVLCQQAPSPDFLRYTRERFGHIPEFLEWSGRVKELDQQVAQRGFSQFKPWGWTQRSLSAEKILDSASSRFESVSPTKTQVDLYRKDMMPPLRHAIRSALSDSQWGFGPDGIDGMVASNIESVLEEVLRIKKEFGLPAAVKSPYGFAGANVCRIYPENGILPSQKAWIENQIGSFDSVLVEPWLLKEYDISFVWESSTSPLKRNVFITDKKGRYRGTKIGPMQNKFDPRDLKELYMQREGLSLLDLMEKVALLMQRHLHNLGYTYAAGIDLFIHRWPFDNKLYLRSLGEINARYTMGHIASKLEKKMAQGRSGYWLTLGISDVKTLNCTSVRELAILLEAKVENKEDLYFTNDPSQANGALSFLVFDSHVIAWLGQNLNLGY